MANKWFVVDTHSHFVPQEAIAKAKAAGVDLSKKMPAFQWAIEMEHRIKVMDDSGVDDYIDGQFSNRFYFKRPG